MPTSTLPISRLINVGVSLSGAAAQSQSLNNLLILTDSTVIDPVARLRTYNTLSGVATDFGTTAEAYKAAALWFAQSPQPTSVQIGRWVQAASAAQLFCAPLTTAQQAISLFTAAGATSGFSITVNGVVQHLGTVNLSAVTTLNGVATAINLVLINATCAWNASLSCFVFTTTTTGPTATITVLSAPTAGTDISGLLGGTASTTSGIYVSPGLASETALAAAALFDAQFGQKYFGLTFASTLTVDADHQAVAAYTEAGTNYHYYGVTTNAAGTLLSSSTTDLAYLLQQAGYNRTFVQYSSTTPYAVVSALARILTTNYQGNNTVIDLSYKQEPSVTPEYLTTTQITAAEAKNANVFVAYNNNTAIIDMGNSCSGLPAALVIGSMAFAVDLQTALYNTLYGSSTKIPQTDEGNHTLATTIERIATQYVNNGFLGPGTWTSGGFGTLSTGDYLAKSYYLYTPPTALQSSASRAAGSSVAFQLAAKFSGAVRNVNLQVNVNQ